MRRVFFPGKQDFSRRGGDAIDIRPDANDECLSLSISFTRTHSRSAPFSLPFSLYRHTLHALINLAIVLVDTR